MAQVVSLVGRIVVLVDRVLICRNGSWRVPAGEVAPASLIAEAMVPLLIPYLIAAEDMWVVVCSLVLVCTCMHG